MHHVFDLSVEGRSYWGPPWVMQLYGDNTVGKVEIRMKVKGDFSWWVCSPCSDFGVTYPLFPLLYHPVCVPLGPLSPRSSWDYAHYQTNADITKDTVTLTHTLNSTGVDKNAYLSTHTHTHSYTRTHKCANKSSKLNKKAFEHLSLFLWGHLQCVLLLCWLVRRSCQGGSFQEHNRI